MPNSSESLSQAEPEPTPPKLPPLAPGELATRLRLIPPIVPVADGHRKHKPKPFFAACAATACNSITEKAVFMAYAALAGPTGATWKVKGQRAHFYARQAKVATTAGCTARTVYTMSLRLLQAGRLLRVLSGRGRIPHVFVVVPDGWYSQFRPEPRSDLNLVDRNHVPINRAFSSKRRAADATRLEEEETPSPVTQPPLASRAAEAVPSKKPDCPDCNGTGWVTAHPDMAAARRLYGQDSTVAQPTIRRCACPAQSSPMPPPATPEQEQKKPDPPKKPGPMFVVARPKQAQPHIDAMLEIIERSEAKDTSPTEASTFTLDPDVEARMVEQDRLHHEGEKGVGPSLDHRPYIRGWGVRSVDMTG